MPADGGNLGGRSGFGFSFAQVNITGGGGQGGQGGGRRGPEIGGDLEGLKIADHNFDVNNSAGDAKGRAAIQLPAVAKNISGANFSPGSDGKESGAHQLAGRSDSTKTVTELGGLVAGGEAQGAPSRFFRMRTDEDGPRRESSPTRPTFITAAVRGLYDKVNEDLSGERPGDDTTTIIPGDIADRLKTGDYVQNGKALLELGRLSDAEAQFKKAIERDPADKTASYYLDLVQGNQHEAESRKRERSSKEMLTFVEKEWQTPNTRDQLDAPNTYARTDLVQTSPERQANFLKLRKIKLRDLQIDGLPLSEVVKQLSDEVKRSDPDGLGVNFIISTNNYPAAAAAGPAVDPNGAPVPPPPAIDVGAVTVKIGAPMRGLTLEHALEIITKVADSPIKYSVEDQGIVLSSKAKDSTPLHTRLFRLDPNKFSQGLQNVSEGFFGSGGGGFNNGVVGQGGPGGAGGGTNGAGGGGIEFVTSVSSLAPKIAAIREFISSAGVDVSAPNALFFNDRTGVLMVRGTTQDLSMVEKAISTITPVSVLPNEKLPKAVTPPVVDPAPAKLAGLSQELAALQSARERLSMQITAGEVDGRIPTGSAVEVISPAEPKSSESSTLWGKIAGVFGGKSESTATISLEKDAQDVPGLGERNLGSPYDPYWNQTEFERIQSKPVLYKVIENLKLNEEWAKKRNGGKKLQTDETFALLKKMLDVRPHRNTSLIDIRVKDEDSVEAARIANEIAAVYSDTRSLRRKRLHDQEVQALKNQVTEQDAKIASAKKELERQRAELVPPLAEATTPKPTALAPIPQPEIQTRDNAFSTFSLNVADVSFKLAAASLERGAMPDVASIRTEEFINAFDYRDPLPAAGVPVSFAWERARYPFAQNRDALRFSIKTAAQGRDGGKPLNLVLLLDNSGSMERADRVQIIQESLRTLAAQLKPQDKISVVTFARTATLRVDGATGAQADEVAKKIGALTPEGGTNLEDALDLAYRTALRHYAPTAINRVVLLTDGAANLGRVEPKALKAKVEGFRKQGVALDCFGIGWEGFNDDLLEQLSRNGDGRYGFINEPGEAGPEFAAQLAGALRVAASDVKVQVQFNPKRVTAYRQVGYAKHQLTKEQFRDNKVDAAEIGAAEAGNAVYIIETNPHGEGPVATVRVRFRIPQTGDFREHEWVVPFGSAVELEQSSPAMRLAAAATAFSELLASSPFATEVRSDRLLGILSGVPEVYGVDPRPKKLEWMVRQAKSISGK